VPTGAMSRSCFYTSARTVGRHFDSPIKHVVCLFPIMSYVFTDPNSLNMFDEEHSDEEDRWVTLGLLPSGTMVVVVHTFRSRDGEEYVRIISARRAAKNEIKQYNERLS